MASTIHEHLIKTVVNYASGSEEKYEFFIRQGAGAWVPRWFSRSVLKQPALVSNFEILPSFESRYPLMETRERPQNSVFKSAVKSILACGGATIVLPCGTGKTNIAIAIALHLRLKTAVLCHNNMLIEQWKKRIEMLIDGNCTIGRVQQGTCDTNHQFVLCSIMSLASRAYDEKHMQFGLVIVDEAHHVPAQTFFRSLKQIQCKYTIGLTATPKRRDGLEDVIFWLLGPVCYKMERTQNNNVQVNFITVTSGKKKEIKYRNGTVGISAMITCLTNERGRNKVLISLIRKLMKTTRKGLLLSDRVNHLKTLYRDIGDPVRTEIVTGRYCSDKTKIDKYACDKQLTLSTFHLFSEAIDFGGDFIILATPKANIDRPCLI